MKPSFLVPEVIQTSAMDCGPAALKAICQGYGVEVSYPRLREACCTEVDGTSIDTLEDVAERLGLDAEQVMIPEDHLLLPEAGALPALAVVRLASGVAHFVVIWRCHGGVVQIMDPGSGRRWVRREALLRQLFVHDLAVAAESWRAWAGTEEFLAPLRARLSGLGFGTRDIEVVVDRALQSHHWRPLAALDAAVRLVGSLVREGGLKRGKSAVAMVSRLSEREADDAQHGNRQAIPESYWSVCAGSPEEPDSVRIRGAVLIRFRGPRPAADAGESAAKDAAQLDSSPGIAGFGKGRSPSATRALIDALRKDGVVGLLAVLAALVTSAGIVLFEGLAYRGLFDAAAYTGLASQRAMAMVALCALVAGLAVIEGSVAALVLRSGRRLETRFRLAILEKIPRLTDRYFRSRLTSDLAERAHNLHLVRELPRTGAQLLRTFSQIVLTTAAIIWIDPGGAPAAIAVAVLALGLPLFCQRYVIERDLAVRTQAGALSRFSLDALLGLVTIRSHEAGAAVRREHEALLVEWIRAAIGLLRAAVSVEAILEFSGFILALWLVIDHLHRNGETGVLLLLVYWALSLPALGRHAAIIVREYPAQRNTVLRLLEPLGAPEVAMVVGGTAQPRDTGEGEAAGGVAIRMDGVSVCASGHAILEHVDLEIAPGSHVAVVGLSGAGKSSLLGLLLGWFQPSAGSVTVDGEVLDGERLADLRRDTVWVDPAIQIWNRSFLDNLRYGNDRRAEVQEIEVLEAAELLEVLEGLGDGMQTVLGEGGGLVSGGEGQRIRLGRGLMREGVRLAILDEPFRGLDKQRRQRLLATARRVWRNATLLCVTHDISQTVDFNRVIVVEGGRVVEDGKPEELREQSSSRFRAMLEDETALCSEVWGEHRWRSLSLHGGRLHDRQAEGS